MFHRGRKPEDEESGLKGLNVPEGQSIRHAQAASHPEPIHWYTLSRTELEEMREGVAHCPRCGGSLVAGECIMCSWPESRIERR